MIRILLLGLILAIALPGSARAADAASARQDLGAVQQKLEIQKKQQAETAKKAANIDSDIRSTRSKLVKTASAIQENERTLKDLDLQIAQLEQRKKTIDDSLLEDRKSMSRLVLALERLRRVPPEAMLARPGAPLQAAQSSLLMQQIMPTIYHQAEKLRASLAEVASISDDLQKKRATALAAEDDLKAEQKVLSALVDKREKLYAETNADLANQQDRVKRISQEASNLQDLVQRLNTRTADNAASHSIKTASLKPPRPGSGRLPVSGVIMVGYGDPDNFGAPSRGLTIEGRPGGLVVAPMGGIVRFAGFFRNYGQLIIIEHQNGYHSLIAGLKKIDTVVGQSVAAGEPLGLLDSASNGSKPTLYYELRLNGKPVNPAVKFDLG